MKNKGFVSTVFVVSVIAAAVIIVSIMMWRFHHNRAMAFTIIRETRVGLADAKVPNCYWGTPPLMKQLPNTASIVLTCDHVDGIKTDLSRLVTRELPDIIQVFRRNPTGTAQQINNITDNENDFFVTLIGTPIPFNNGFRIFIELNANTTGNYYLVLRPNVLETNAGVNNIQVSTLDFQEVYITVE